MTRARAPDGAQLCCSPSPGQVRSGSSPPAPPSAPPSSRGSHVEAAIARRLFVGLAPGADRVTGRARRPHGPSGSMPRSPAPYRSVIIVTDAADWQRRRERNGAVQSADHPGHAMLPPSGGAVPKPLRNAPAGVGARDPRDQRGHRASVPQAALSRGGPSKLAVAARDGVGRLDAGPAARAAGGFHPARVLRRPDTTPARPRRPDRSRFAGRGPCPRRSRRLRRHALGAARPRPRVRPIQAPAGMFPARRVRMGAKYATTGRPTDGWTCRTVPGSTAD